MSRPFYTEYAWAFDLLIERPVTLDSSGIVRMLVQRGVGRGGRILDGGCGTGRYGIELARLGYRVTCLDLSTELLAEAQKHMAQESISVALVRGDILALPFTKQFDALLCRGVLNDLLDTKSRQEAFISFAEALRPGGALVLDVREWDATIRRKKLEPVFEKSVQTPRGVLTFRSETRLDYSRQQLHVTEQHRLRTDEGETISEYDFSMGCWTKAELESSLTAAGFGSIRYFGDYDGVAPSGATDRLVCAASLLVNR